METIKNYLDNMFAGLPKTTRVLELKNNIFTNMEEKYNELKRQGKSENEAIGIVISEFGNIDELVSELGIRKDDQTKSQPVVTKEEVEKYLVVKKVMGIQISIGVFLCILAPALLILISNLLEDGIISNHLNSDTMGIPGVIVLFVLITVAVGIFIFSGMAFEQYKYMESGVQISSSLEADLKSRYDRYTPIFYLKLITGVCLIILSPISLFIASLIGDNQSRYGVVILLILVAFSVFLFITSGTIRESYEKILNISSTSTSKPKKNEDKVIGAVAAVIWPLAFLIFFFTGIVYDLWHISWIVFPVTGILFGMFSAAYSIITSKNE